MTEEMREKFLSELKRAKEMTDIEAEHSIADGVLVDALIALGYEDLTDIWIDVDKWYC